MVAAFVQNLGAVGSSVSGTTLVLTLSGLAQAVAVGNYIIIHCANASVAATSCADSQGNTYSLDASGPAVDPRVHLFSAKVTTALNNGDTITVTSGSSSGRTFRAVEYSGLDPSSRFDTSAGGSGSSAAADSTTTGTLAQADNLIVAVVGHVATTTNYAWETLSPVWNDLGTSVSTGTVRTGHAAYRVVSSTSGVAAKATWTTSRAWAALVGVYKAAPDSVPPRRRMTSYLPH